MERHSDQTPERLEVASMTDAELVHYLKTHGKQTSHPSERQQLVVAELESRLSAS